MIDSDGQPIKSTKSSFYHSLRRLEWVPAYRPKQGGQLDRKYLCPNSVYLSSPEVTNLLGTHVDYVDISSSDFSRALGKNVSFAVAITFVHCYSCWLSCKGVCNCVPALVGMRETISVDVLINYLKTWCIKPEEDVQEQRLPEDESKRGTFTSTIQHIHNVYTYLQQNCSQGSLKELFQHTPAVFIENERYIIIIFSIPFQIILKVPENHKQYFVSSGAVMTGALDGSTT